MEKFVRCIDAASKTAYKLRLLFLFCEDPKLPQFWKISIIMKMQSNRNDQQKH